MPKQDLEAVMAQFPDLNYFGMGVFEPRTKTPEERAKELQAGRVDMLEHVDMFDAVCEWLRNMPALQNVNLRRTSYGLKHLAERSLGSYVANGIFIAAALHCGYPYRRIENSPNMSFGISEKALKTADQESRAR
jgi:hypothetical protein